MSKPEPLLSALLDHLLERARNSPAFVDLDLSTILPNSSDASYRSTLIALAGYLLEYPIVYSLYDEERHSAALRNCLGGQELSLIKIALRESSSGDSSVSPALPRMPLIDVEQPSAHGVQFPSLNHRRRIALDLRARSDRFPSSQILRSTASSG